MQKTLKRLEEKIHGRVCVSVSHVLHFLWCSTLGVEHHYLNIDLVRFTQVLKHLLYLMRSVDKVVQRRVACTLAHLCSPDDQRTIFIEHHGMIPSFSSSTLFFSVQSKR